MKTKLIKISALAIGMTIALSACSPQNPVPPIPNPVTTTTTVPVTTTTQPSTTTTIPVTTSTTTTTPVTTPVVDASYELAKCGYKYADVNSGEISPNFTFKVTPDKITLYFSVAPTSVTNAHDGLPEIPSTGLDKIRAAKSGDTVVLTHDEVFQTIYLTYATGSGDIIFYIKNQNNLTGGSGLGTGVGTADAGIHIFSNTNYEARTAENGYISTSQAYNGTWLTTKYFGSQTKDGLLQLLNHLAAQVDVNVPTPIGQGFTVRSQIIEQTFAGTDQTRTIAFYNANGVGCSGQVHLSK